MKYIITIVVALLILILAFVAYMGMFNKTEILEQEMGPYTVAYQEFTGPYTDVGPAMDAVYQALVVDGIEATLGFGIYLDDPQAVAKEELRSEVGSIINKEDIAKLNRSGEIYKVKTITRKNSLVAEFPYKNPLSFMMGPMKIYTDFMKYMEKENIEWTPEMTALEIYNLTDKKITFIVNLK